MFAVGKAGCDENERYQVADTVCREDRNTVFTHCLLCCFHPLKGAVFSQFAAKVVNIIELTVLLGLKTKFNY